VDCIQQSQQCASAPTTPLGDDVTRRSIAATAACVFYEAVDDYTAIHDGELDLICGDVVTDVKDLGNGWTLGRRIDGTAGDETRPTSSSAVTVGIFPSNCVQPMLTDAAGTCPYIAGAAAEGCPGCCVQDGRTAYHARWTTAVRCDCSDRTAADDQQRYAARFNFVEASDDDDDDVGVYRMGLRSYGTAVVHSSLPRKPGSQCYQAPQQRRLASTGSSGGLGLQGESVAESDDVRRGLVSAPSPVMVCSGREMTAAEMNKPRMIVKPNLDRSVMQQQHQHGSTSTASSAATAAAATDAPRNDHRDVCYCSPAGYVRSAVPPRELPISARYDDWSTQRGSDFDDAETRATMSDYCTAMRRTSTETSSHKSHSRRIVDVPLPAPTPLDRRALSADSNCKLSLSGTDDGPTCDSRCSEVTGLYRDGGGGGGGGGVCPSRSVYDSGYYAHSLTDSRSCRLVMSVVVGHLIGVAVFLWMFFHLGYGPMTAVVASSTVAVVTCVLLALSRVCRSTAALTVPSLCTANGRVAFVVVAAGFLLAGPVTNVYVNMEEISRAMGCSAEQAYNQTMFLLQPFDAMMVQLNWTIGGLQQAARNISRGLKPLEDGLDLVEMDLYNGKLQLYGTRKVSRCRCN